MKRLIRNGILLLLTVLLILPAGSFTVADEVMFGDADGDGRLTAQDASCISRHLNRFRMMDAAALSRADYDGDGVITERDSSLILSALMSPDFSVMATQSFSMLITSDLAGNAWDPSDDGSFCTAINTATCIQTLREQDPSLLLFDAGGSFFGSSIADDYKDSTDRSYGPITSLFIRLGYNAVSLGDEAFSYPSQNVRREVNALQDRGIPVLGANLQKSDPTIFDSQGALWDDLLPYVILEVPQGEDRDPMRVAVIGMTDPELCVSEDEITAANPIEIYARLRKELKNRADYTVLLYHGNTEVDAQRETAYSLRDLLKKTDSIDLVVASHAGVHSVRSERNAGGREIPIVTLAGGAKTVTEISVSLRSEGNPAIQVTEIDASKTEPDAALKASIKPYVSRLSGMMDTAICTLASRIDPFDAHALCSTDSMDLTHEMQLYLAQNWIDYHDVDLPNELISIAYPYIPIGGQKEGVLKYRDLYMLQPETPHYTIMLIRGSELRAWLKAYAGTIMQQDTIYSLYGLSYLLNTMNPDAPLGYLEHGSGRSVDDDEVFTLILAERSEGDLSLRSFLDETWMSYEDRIIEGFTLPTPSFIQTTGENPIIDALIAYLENFEVYKPEHIFSWIVI